MLEQVVALVVVLAVAALLALLVRCLLRLRTTEVRGKPQPEDYLSEQDLEKLMTENRPEGRESE